MKPKITSLLILSLFMAVVFSGCIGQTTEPTTTTVTETTLTTTEPFTTTIITTTQPISEVKEFMISAKRFDFTPSTITMDKGDQVRLKITSTDVTHGFAIDEYGIDERLPPNQEVVIEFTADKAGTFTFYCSVFCGSGHSTMKGQLIVEG